MKRINYLFEQIVSIENIELADERARKHKTKNWGVIKHDRHRREQNEYLQQILISGQYKTSQYSTFKVYEPKERIIYRLPYFPDRVVHHAIMNILEPVWTKIFIANTYSCIKGRGIHKCKEDVEKALRNDKEGTKYCLKLDITKFYPSIDHEILKKIIRKKIKDVLLLTLLDSIIDSAEGVPIGNYLSQFFANLYLAYFDHYVKEKLRVKYYFRYADDIVLLCDSKEQLRFYLNKIREYLDKLKLKIKPSYQIFLVDSRGINFVGYILYHTHTMLRKSIKNKIFKLINKYINNKIQFSKFINSIQSYFGWLKYCNSKNLLHKIQQKINLKFSNWKGKQSIISNFYGKTLYIVEVIIKNKYYLIHFIYKNISYSIKSKNKKLLIALNKTTLPNLFKFKHYARSKKNSLEYQTK